MSSTLYQDDPELIARAANRARQAAADSIEFQTTADRLIGLLQEECVEVRLTDDVTLSFYPPTDDDYMDIMKFRVDGLQVAASAKRIQVSRGLGEALEADMEDAAIRMIPDAVNLVNGARDMLDSLNHILSRLSVDPSFTPEAFKRMPKKYKNIILNELSDSYSGELSKTQKFRSKQKRKGTSPDANGLGSNPS